MESPVNKPKPRSGGCFCGAIKYAFYGLPAQVIHCHCNTCRKLSGNAFSTYFAVSNRQIYLRKESMLRKFRSAADEVRGFCVKCGCCIFIKFNFEENTMWIHGGTINDKFGIKISGHIFIDQKAPWFEINDGLPQSKGDELWVKDAADPLKNLPRHSDIIDTHSMTNGNRTEKITHKSITNGDSAGKITRQDSAGRRGDLVRMHYLVKTEDGKIFRSMSSGSESSIDDAAERRCSFNTISEDEEGAAPSDSHEAPNPSKSEDRGVIEGAASESQVAPSKYKPPFKLEKRGSTEGAASEPNFTEGSTSGPKSSVSDDVFETENKNNKKVEAFSGDKYGNDVNLDEVRQGGDKMCSENTDSQSDADSFSYKDGEIGWV